VVLVQKPGKIRLCSIAEKLSQKDAYSLPQIDGILGRFPKAIYILSLDLKDAYWQIPNQKKNVKNYIFGVFFLYYLLSLEINFFN